MAKMLSENQQKELQEKSRLAVEKKTASQKKQGKDFEVEPYSAGVIPEKVWEGYKVK